MHADESRLLTRNEQTGQVLESFFSGTPFHGTATFDNLDEFDPPPLAGIVVPVSLSTLAHEGIVAPGSPEWFFHAVRKLLPKNVKLNRSVVDERPDYDPSD